MPTSVKLERFWSLAPGDLMAQLQADPGGLTSAEAKRRLVRSGPNRLHTRKRTDVLTLLLAQFKNPLILILLGAVMLSWTWKPFYTSMPSTPLLSAMIIVLLFTLALPYSPLSDLLGLTPLPISTLLLLGIITVLYAGASELTKKLFHSRAFDQGNLMGQT